MSALLAWGSSRVLPHPVGPNGSPRARRGGLPIATLRAGSAVLPARGLLAPMPQIPQTPPAAAVGPVAHQRRSHGRPAPAIRLTARGRLVRTMVVFGVLALLALAYVQSTGEDLLTVERHVVVQFGETLTEVARRELPRLPVEEGVARLQVVNKLVAPEVVAGQSLAVPGSP